MNCMGLSQDYIILWRNIQTLLRAEEKSWQEVTIQQRTNVNTVLRKGNLAKATQLHLVVSYNKA